MTDEQETNHAFARSRSNAGLGTTLRHRRFIYKFLVAPRLGIVCDGIELYMHLENAHGKDWSMKFNSPVRVFEATFRYVSEFVEWIDHEWVETNVPNVERT